MQIQNAWAAHMFKWLIECSVWSSDWTPISWQIMNRQRNTIS